MNKKTIFFPIIQGFGGALVLWSSNVGPFFHEFLKQKTNSGEWIYLIFIFFVSLLIFKGLSFFKAIPQSTGPFSYNKKNYLTSLVAGGLLAFSFYKTGLIPITSWALFFLLDPHTLLFGLGALIGLLAPNFLKLSKK